MKGLTIYRPSMFCLSMAMIFSLLMVFGFGVTDDRLFVDETEALRAFDNSHDGWRLYSFNINTEWLADGKLAVSIHPSTVPLEGWGGPDYSELHLFAESTSVPEPCTTLLLCTGLLGLIGLSGTFKKRVGIGEVRT
jgi:hypothetical protein